MSERKIDYTKCENCELAKNDKCPIVETCHADVFRCDSEGKLYFAYPQDCDSCFWCELDCPKRAIQVTALIDLPLLETW
jgi:NAD-dependent dihydropyrimidine dehydrogenase PreA subunit